MIISEEKYCIASKEFPLKFYDNKGYEYDVFNRYILMDKKDCEYELNEYDEPEEYQILKVQVSYEF